MLSTIFQSPSEYEQATLVNLSGAIWFFIGILVFAVILSIREWVKKMDEEDEKASLLIVDHSQKMWKPIGKFEGYVSFLLPVKGGLSEKKWAIQITGFRGTSFVIPAYGEKEDMIMMNDQSKRLILMFAKIIGDGSQGQEVISEWTEQAFPEEVYGKNRPHRVPANFILVRPLWNQSMSSAVFDNAVFGTMHMYSVMNKLLCDHQKELEMTHTKYGQMFIAQNRENTAHSISQWQHVLEAWDATMMERTTPLFVISRLLHISPEQVGATALGQTMNHGGFQQLASFAQAIKRNFEELGSNLGYWTMPEDSAEIMLERTNQLRQDLVDASRQRLQMERDNKQLIDALQAGRARGSTQTGNPSIPVGGASN